MLVASKLLLDVQHLKISGDFDHTRIRLGDLTSLVHADLTLYRSEYNEIDETVVEDLLVSIHCANELMVSSWFIKVISDLLFEEEDFSLPLLECKWLTISSRITKYCFPCINSLSRSTPYLENLMIFPTIPYCRCFLDENIVLSGLNYLTLQDNIFKVSLQNLKNVKSRNLGVSDFQLRSKVINVLFSQLRYRSGLVYRSLILAMNFERKSNVITMSEPDQSPDSSGDDGYSKSPILENPPQRKMKIETECEEMGIDWISELPDALIVQILSQMATPDAFRTTILSKRWQYLWTSIDSVIFYNRNTDWSDRVNVINKFISFTDNVLPLLCCSKTKKFTLYFRFCLVASYSSKIDKWLEIALKKKVEDLDLEIWYYDQDPYVLHKFSAAAHPF
ncbi:hypothetical protein K7X08_018566 [Anisodus acutangulus]|uniref:F-box domain-containing protein n=1 Tax=Anisodus acutangulus TaxID=402998 RepID=A0A9Q1R915_9SOLA|nr:hypothetical protein K7X08_018566 [Anisodus acutangulus]